jgi:hypothetical protein
LARRQNHVGWFEGLRATTHENEGNPHPIGGSTMHAMWVHGNTAAAQFVGGLNFTSPGTGGHEITHVNNQNWTEIVGLPQGPGKIFRGRHQTDNYFHFCIPTPVILNDRRVRLERVFVLFSSDPDVQVRGVYVFDGMNPIDWSGMPAGVSGRHDGSAGLADLQENITMHRIETRPEIFWGIGISVQVGFSREGNITFTAVGADFS